MRRAIALAGVVAMLLALGVPAGAQSDPITRIAGGDRTATTVAISQAHFDPASTDVVYVARADDYPDALTAGPLAGHHGGPIILTPTNSLPPLIRAEIARLTPSRIAILGGTAAVSPGVEAELRTIAPTERLAGPTRFETAAAIAARMPDPSTVYLATGQNYPDALAIGAVAGAGGNPILLTTRDALPATTAQALRSLNPSTVVIVGGEGVVGAGVEAGLAASYRVNRVAGAGRYETAAAILALVDAADHAYVTTGAAFADALTATPAAIARGAPVALSPVDALPAGVDAQLRRLGITGVTVIGGNAAIGPNVVTGLRAIAAEEPTPPPPPPTEEPSPPPVACDPAYPDVCIAPPPPDLGCEQIAYRNFRVLPPDPHGFDGNGNGIGCEVAPPPQASEPSQPVNVSAAPGETSIMLTWAPPADDGGSPVTGYRVTRDGRDSTGFGAYDTSVDAAARGFQLTRLIPGQTYTVTVQAVNAVGEGQAVSRRVTIPEGQPPPGAPGAPRSVTATPGATTISLTWEPPASDGGSPITGYLVARDGRDSAGHGSYETVRGAAARSFEFTRLIPGETYTVRLTALNAVGVGTAVSRTVTLPPPTSVPTVPREVSAESTGTNTITVTWEAPASDGGSPITGYRVTRDGFDLTGHGAYATTVPATRRSFELTRLNPAHTYTVRVQAVNAVGLGPAATVRHDTIDPAVLSISARNGGVPDVLDRGDVITVTFNYPAQYISQYEGLQATDAEGRQMAWECNRQVDCLYSPDGMQVTLTLGQPDGGEGVRAPARAIVTFWHLVYTEHHGLQKWGFRQGGQEGLPLTGF